MKIGSVFTYKMKYYSNKDGTAISSPLLKLSGSLVPCQLKKKKKQNVLIYKVTVLSDIVVQGQTVLKFDEIFLVKLH